MNSFETQGNKEPQKEEFMTVANEHEHIKETNQMQMELVKLIYGEGTNETFEKWKKEYSKKFREILDAKIRENPHFLRDYSDFNTHAAILESLKQDLQGDKDAENIIDFYQEKFDKAA